MKTTGPGTRDPGPGKIEQLDRDVLLAHVLGCSRSGLWTRPAGLTPRQQEHFSELVERRAGGEPVAYLTGEREFWSLPLKITPAVLIPRPETELLVEWALALFPGPGSRVPGPVIWDLGTGSGAIALALAREHPQARIMATDISSAALAIASDNAARLGITNVEFLEGSWLSVFPGPGSRVPGPDLIISNPPYVAENDPHLADLRFEPATALTAGPDGLSALRQITVDAGKFLKPGGWLLLEHGAEQGAAVRELFRSAGFRSIATRRDLAGHERATAGQAA